MPLLKAMKNRVAIFILLALVTLFPTFVLNAQTNALGSLILPPSDWNLKQHILYPLMATNKPDVYQLPAVWTGIEKVTVCTGLVYTVLNIDKADQTTRQVRLDTFRVWAHSTMPGIPEDRALEDSVHGRTGGLYRSSLPTDDELFGMRDFAAVKNFVGKNGGFSTNANATSMGFHYVTLGPYNSIDTLFVAFGKLRGSGTNFDSILIRRGRLYPH
jgi:hypothetical protein